MVTSLNRPRLPTLEVPPRPRATEMPDYEPVTRLLTNRLKHSCPSTPHPFPTTQQSSRRRYGSPAAPSPVRILSPLTVLVMWTSAAAQGLAGQQHSSPVIFRLRRAPRRWLL